MYPPVDVSFFGEVPRRSVKRHGYLVVSALVPYKRVDLAVRWANASGEPLLVVGRGSELDKLKQLAGPCVTFKEDAERNDLRDAYRRARALLFCGVEDFGIVPVEAMAAGCPVVAFGHGGALETVVGTGSEKTGEFFSESTIESLGSAIERLEKNVKLGAFQPDVLLERAEMFSRIAFKKGLCDYFRALGFNLFSPTNRAVGTVSHP
mgnify:CR=1 FL=1